MELKGKVSPTKLLIKKIKRVQKTRPSGLVIPDTAEEITSLGIVIRIGRGTEYLPMDVKVGDSVMFPPRAPIKTVIEEISAKILGIEPGEYWILNLQDVLLYWS